MKKEEKKDEKVQVKETKKGKTRAKEEIPSSFKIVGQ